jgi:CDP-paratose 2-epimerase
VVSVVIVTGSCGLVGAETVRLLASQGLDVIGIDNDMRRSFFGAAASTAWQARDLAARHPGYTHLSLDIRDADAIDALFARHARCVTAVVHCAAQPSHDWAAREPMTDFGVNATGTLILLEAVRRHAPDAVFVFASTNKVYGDQPNWLPTVEQPSRYELAPEHPWAEHGIPEAMSVDRCLHSLFGVSKLSADLLVQEYGRYFGLRTACFRCGCITGPGHSGAPLHGFLAYLVRCAVEQVPYSVIGYGGRQVRDNIHAADLAAAFWCFIVQPAEGEVFNMGGGRQVNCSVNEAIAMVEALQGRAMTVDHVAEARIGDHRWWISDVRKFRARYPGWSPRFDIRSLIADIQDGLSARLRDTARAPAAAAR